MTRPSHAAGPGPEAGLTVIELLVSLTIVAIALAGLAMVLPLSSYGLQQGTRQSTSVFLAEQRLEQVRAAAWTAVPLTDCLGTSGSSLSGWSFDGGAAPAPVGCHPAPLADETPSGDPLAVPSTRLPDPYRQYTRQVRIRPCDTASASCGVVDATIRLVTVRVSYPALGRPDGAPATQFVELTSLVARK